MIAYFDTSAFLPILLEEAGSGLAEQLWDDADRVLTVQVTYVEARAGLARAHRMGRLDPRQLRRLVRQLDRLDGSVEKIDIDHVLVRRAGDLAEEFALRGYDAIHLAALARLEDPHAIMVSGDRELCRAAAKLGMPVCDTSDHQD